MLILRGVHGNTAERGKDGDEELPSRGPKLPVSNFLIETQVGGISFYWLRYMLKSEQEANGSRLGIVSFR